MINKELLNKSRQLFLPGLMLFLMPGMLRAYLLMPFPGSQELEAISLAYFLERSLPFTRIAGALLMVTPIADALLSGTMKRRILVGSVSLFSAAMVYFTDYYFSAENMFREPTQVAFANVHQNKVDPEKMIIGVVHNGVAKAFPINFIAYHHKVQDSVAGMPVLVTYCTMCRTGRVFSPILGGKHQVFRLVGARHYNAVIEDAETKSWWYQESGDAAAGPLRGSFLNDIPCDQVSLKSWIEQYPNTLILQPDANFTEEYDGLANYDRALRIQKDSSGMFPTWQKRSWVIGITALDDARAYDWIDLLRRRVINDRLGSLAVVLVVEDDTVSFHAWNRIVDGTTLEFIFEPSTGRLKDTTSGSVWNWQGVCIEGKFTSTRLQPVQARQEYWHSWLNFHKNTSRWEK